MVLNANPNWFLLDTMWSKEAAAFAKADLEYKANDVKLRLNALYPFPFPYESGEQKMPIEKKS